MKNMWFIGVMLAVLALLGFSGIASAQASIAPKDAASRGIVHDYLVAYTAETLGLTVEEIESRLESGETLAEIAYASGVEDFASFMQSARAYVLDELAADGLSIPGWVNGNGLRSRQNGLGLQGGGTCTLTFNGKGYRGSRP